MQVPTSTSCALDVELFCLVSTFFQEISSNPMNFQQRLPACLDRVDALLGKGARPDVQVLEGYTALSMLAQCGPSHAGLEPLASLLRCWTINGAPPVNLQAAARQGR